MHIASLKVINVAKELQMFERNSGILLVSEIVLKFLTIFFIII